MEEIEWPQFSKLWLLRHQNCLRVFLSWFCWVLPAAIEAKRRYIWQPSKATIPWSSGSFRRRRPWMHITKRAVASEEDLVGKPHEAWDRCEMLMVQVFRGFFVFHFLWQVSQCNKTFAYICTNIFCCLLWSRFCRFLDIHLLLRNRMKSLWIITTFGSDSILSWSIKYVLVHYPRHLDCRNPKATVFCNQLDVIKTYQNHKVSLSPERILSGPNFQNFDLRHQNFLRILSP